MTTTADAISSNLQSHYTSNPVAGNPDLNQGSLNDLLHQYWLDTLSDESPNTQEQLDHYTGQGASGSAFQDVEHDFWTNVYTP